MEVTEVKQAPLSATGAHPRKSMGDPHKLFTTQEPTNQFFKRGMKYLIREKRSPRGSDFKRWCTIQGKQHELRCYPNRAVNFSTSGSYITSVRMFSKLENGYRYPVELWEITNRIYKGCKYQNLCIGRHSNKQCLQWLINSTGIH